MLGLRQYLTTNESAIFPSIFAQTDSAFICLFIASVCHSLCVLFDNLSFFLWTNFLVSTYARVDYDIIHRAAFYLHYIWTHLSERVRERK